MTIERVAIPIPARPARPGHHRARVLVAGLGLQLAFGIVFAWGAVMPLVRAQDHWPPLLLGAVFSATPAGYGIGAAVAGRLADRLPPRGICWASVALLAAGFGTAFLTPSGLTFVAAYAFLALGLGGGAGTTGAVAAMARVLPDATGAVGGATSAVYASAAVFQAPLIGVLTPILGWLGALRAVGLGMLLLSAGLLAVMPSLPGRGAPRKSAHSLSLLRNPGVARGFMLALCAAPFGSFAAVNVGMLAATAAVTTFAAGNAAGRLLAGVAADGALIDMPAAWAVMATPALAGLVLLATFHNRSMAP